MKQHGLYDCYYFFNMFMSAAKTLTKRDYKCDYDDHRLFKSTEIKLQWQK